MHTIVVRITIFQHMYTVFAGDISFYFISRKLRSTVHILMHNDVRIRYANAHTRAMKMNATKVNAFKLKYDYSKVQRTCDLCGS